MVFSLPLCGGLGSGVLFASEDHQESIQTPPEGSDTLNYSLNGTFERAIGSTQLSGVKLMVVWEPAKEDGTQTVWFHNLFPHILTVGWTHGTYRPASHSITIPVQAISNFHDGWYEKDYVFNIAGIKYSGTTIQGMKDSIVFDVDTLTGHITSQQDEYIGLVTLTDKGKFNKAYGGARNLTIMPLTIDPVVTPPEGLEPEEYLYRYANSSGNPKSKFAPAIVTDTTAYFACLTPDLTRDVTKFDYDVWVKGTFDSEGMLHVRSGQYLGDATGFNLYMNVVRLTERDDADNLYTEPLDEAVFAYQDGVFCLQDSDVMITEGSQDGTPWYLYSNFRIGKYAGDVPTVPSDPFGLKVTETIQSGYTDPFYYMDFYANTEGENGEYLNPDSLYWRFWMDGDLFVFDMDWYKDDFDEPTTTVPFRYQGKNGSSKNFKILNDYNGAYFWFFESLWNYVGIQMVYIVGGEERCSNIVYVDLEGNVIPGGIPEVEGGKEQGAGGKEQGVGIYDLAGRKLPLGQSDQLAPSGLYIINGRKVFVR